MANGTRISKVSDETDGGVFGVHSHTVTFN